MADDDVPLAALAKKPSVSKVTDDTPLSSLAGGAPKNTPQKKAAPKGAPAPKPAGANGSPAAPRPAGAPGGKAAGKGKNGAAKRRASSSSSSSSYSYSSSDSEDAKKAKPKLKKAGSGGGGGGGKPAKKKGVVMKQRKSQEEGMGEGGNEYVSGGKISKKERNPKEDVVAQLLCRWWFADEYIKDEWPPQDEDFYTERLKAAKLRKVSMQEWEWLPDEDDKGNKKVYELSQYRGVFRNSHGDMVDLRPKETCPCLNNFMKKDMVTLTKMLISAYENQLKELATSRYVNMAEKSAQEIKLALSKVRSLHHQSVQATGVGMR